MNNDMQGWHSATQYNGKYIHQFKSTLVKNY